MNLESINLKNFVHLNDDEKLMVLSWRNDESIRKWMYTLEVISVESHFKFINNLKTQEDSIYFLVQQNNNNIGIVYFYKIDYKNKECNFGLYTNPFEKIAGVGRILEEVCIKYAFDNLKFNKLKLEIFEDNRQVRNLHNKYKFQEVGEKVINNIKVICMELKNEDR